MVAFLVSFLDSFSDIVPGTDLASFWDCFYTKWDLKSKDFHSKLYVGVELNKGSSVSLWDIRNQISVSSSDIGVGVSQLLPLVVASQSDKKGIIACEQPELHVHPRVQVAIGDLLSQNCEDKQFLIETHSEHLILRILRRIRETCDEELSKGMTPVQPTEISIVYLEPNEQGVASRRLRIDKDGEFIDRWPHGFFAERAEELF